MPDYLANLLEEALSQAAVVAVQNPIWLNNYTEPLPDIVLLKPAPT